MLIIDGTYLVYKSYYRAKKIKDMYEVANQDHFKKIVRNMFLKSVAKLKNKFNPTSLFIVFDAEGDNFRDELLPSYKSHRKEKPEDLFEAKSEIYHFLNMHNFSFQIAQYEEGDDLIASFVHQFPDQQMMIFTGDADMAALVNNNVTLLLEKKKKILTITCENFHHYFPVPASKIADYKALQGDKSDFIKGVGGLLRTEVIHLLMEYTSVEDFLEHGQQHYAYAKIAKEKEKVLINKQVTSMKTDCVLQVTLAHTKLTHIYMPAKLAAKIHW